jgi:nicotinate phosphoribosyltransferase
MSFPTEEESFRVLQKLLGESTVFLIDTYDTIEGARLAARVGSPCWGLRLDSGDIVTQSREVRRVLDEAGMQTAKIFATNDLNEYRLAELVRAGAPIDAFGVGTQLATSADAPTLSVVYKLVEIRRDKVVHYAAKFSDEKSTLPGAKQIYRYPDHDVVALASECNSDFSGGEPLIRPIFAGGRLVESLPAAPQIRAYAHTSIGSLPKQLLSLEESIPYKVEISPRLVDLAESLRTQHQPVRQ